jgi:hypothetical protein
MSVAAARRHRQPRPTSRRRQRGLAAVELALITPLMMLIVMGGYDLYRYVQASAIIDRVAFTLAYELSQAPGLPYGSQCNASRTATGCGAHALVQRLLTPLDYARVGLDVRVYRVRQENGGWQACWTGTGVAPDATRFPPGPAGSTLVAVRVSYPASFNLLPDDTLQAHAFSRATGAQAGVLCP